MNLTPLPYRRVSIQKFPHEFTEPNIRALLIGREAYFATDYIILNRDPQYCVIQIEKQTTTGMFALITKLRIVAKPEDCIFCHDESVDASSPTALAAKAKSLGLGNDLTLIVSGAFSHVNFIHRPQAVTLNVIDLVPPAKSRLIDLVEKAIQLVRLPPLLIQPRMIDVNVIASAHPADAHMFPCRASGLQSTGKTYFLDEHPDSSDALLVGCERTADIYKHFYGKEPNRVETCPQKIWKTESGLAILRCCALQSTIEVKGSTATVPWGAEVSHVVEALQGIVSNAKLEYSFG